jgi:hypothetical protein
MQIDTSPVEMRQMSPVFHVGVKKSDGKDGGKSPLGKHEDDGSMMMLRMYMGACRPYGQDGYVIENWEGPKPI